MNPATFRPVIGKWESWAAGNTAIHAEALPRPPELEGARKLKLVVEPLKGKQTFDGGASLLPHSVGAQATNENI